MFGPRNGRYCRRQRCLRLLVQPSVGCIMLSMVNYNFMWESVSCAILGTFGVSLTQVPMTLQKQKNFSIFFRAGKTPNSHLYFEIVRPHLKFWTARFRQNNWFRHSYLLVPRKIDAYTVIEITRGASRVIFSILYAYVWCWWCPSLVPNIFVVIRYLV